MTPVPVIALLAGIQPAVVAVRVAGVNLHPVNAIGAIFVRIPAMIIAMVGIVITRRTADAGDRCNKGESQNKWGEGIQYSFHTGLDAAGTHRDRPGQAAPKCESFGRGVRRPTARVLALVAFEVLVLGEHLQAGCWRSARTDPI
jgi:hypothetical protein